MDEPTARALFQEIVDRVSGVVSAPQIDDAVADNDPQASFVTRSATKIAALISTAITGVNAAIAAVAAAGLQIGNNLGDLANKGAARLNLGLDHLAVNPAWYGLVEGDDAAHGPTNTAALAAALADLANLKRSRIAFPGGTYWFADNGSGAGIDITSGALVIEGGGAGGNDNGTGAVRAILKFPAGISGIRVQGAQTSGANTKDGAIHADARGTVLRNLVLQGGFTTTEGEHHGIQARTRVTCENVTVLNFEGDGFYVGADGGAASGASPPFGNANVCRLINCTAQGNRSGMFFDGDNANACVIVSPNLNSNRQWGYWDSSGFGNSVVGGQIATNGTTAANDGVTIAATVVSSGGNQYGAIVGQEPWCSINAPSGTAADNQGWYFLRAGGPQTGIPAWFNGIIVRAGGAPHTDSGVGASQFTGVYAEGDQGKAQIWEPSLVIGGILATWCFQNQAAPGTAATPLIRGGQNNGGLVHVEPAIEVVSGAVTTTVGGTLANANNRILMMQHPTFAPGVGYQLEFASGGSTGDIRFTYQDGTTNVWWVTTPTTTAQFGTGAAVPHAFSPLKLMLQDNASAIANARHAMVDTAAPATGAHGQGEWCFFRGVTAGLIGWKCTAAGTPGTWEAVYSGYSLGPVGYQTGAGGAIPQATNKATGVTLNKLTGQVTTAATALAAAAVASFTVTDSQIVSTDTINLNLQSGNATAGTYRYWIDKVSNGSFVIAVENRSAGSLSEALVFNFTVVKGVIA